MNTPLHTTRGRFARIFPYDGYRGRDVLEVGCGMGCMAMNWAINGAKITAVDLNPVAVAQTRQRFAVHQLAGTIHEADAEALPFPDASFDGVLLSGVVHHFPDPARCAAEVFRVLRPQGRFVAFDPNRMNPFMWLYRDRASPFYSSLGVTENERPVLAREVAAVFERTGFTVSSHYISGLAYRYVASRRAQLLLPVYNFIDAVVFGLGFMERLRPFVLTAGTKR